MAIVAALVYAGHNRLRYLITSTAGGETIDLEGDGGATPDMLTDALAGPLRQILLVKTQGYGPIAAGGLATDAQASGLLQSDLAADAVFANYITGARILPTAITRVEQRTGTPRAWTFVAVRGPSDTATLGLTFTNTSSGAASCYVDIEVPGTIGA
jgi:hypothetical protein